MATLLVKHLPSVLSDDSITEFFQHYGAIDVKIMQGKMKGSVYVTCKDPEEAKRVLVQLQGLKFLDKTLTAEVAKEKQTESTETVTPAVPTKQEPEVSNDDKQPFEPIAPTLGINYPANPLLEYRYPNPNPLILTNILNAMTARPKFYTQVLHLMNKMNLPPPFGPPAPALPMQPEGMKRKRDNDVEEEEESEEEDELEDFPPTKKGGQVAPGPQTGANASSSAAIAQKLIQQQQQQLTEQLLQQQQQQQQQSQQQQQQQQHLQQLQQQLQQQTQQLQQQAQTLAYNPAAFNGPLPTPTPLAPLPGMPAGASSKKQPAIQIVLKPDAASNVPFLLPSQQQQQQQFQLQQQQQQIQITQQQIQQQQQLLQQQQQLLQTINPTPLSKYATSEEIAQNRATLAEIKEIDKKYDKGEPSVKLYIKNLNHKSVEISDLERIFGKFFPNEQAMKDGLDIKLMKEGRMRGQAFVTFQDEELAEEAMEEVNGFKLHDKPMIIQYGKK